MNPWEIHPALVHFPIALLLAAAALELAAFRRGREHLRRAANGLLAAGVVAGLLAAGAGFLAFYTVPAHTEEAHELMYWHLGFALGSLALFAAVAVARFRRRGLTGGGGDPLPAEGSAPARPVASALMVVASLLLLTAGYLGGHVVYRGGAGIDPALLAPEVREGHTHGHEEGDHAKAHEGGDGHEHEGVHEHPER